MGQREISPRNFLWAERDFLDEGQRECALLTTYWSESTSSSRWFGGPAPRHGSLNSFSQEALHLPFQPGGGLIAAGRRDGNQVVDVSG